MSSDWDPQTLLKRTYTMLTDLEAVELPLYSSPNSASAPSCHKTQNRSDGHLFITVIALPHWPFQTIRRRLADTRRERQLRGPLCVVSSKDSTAVIRITSRRKDDSYPPRPQGSPVPSNPNSKGYTALDLHPAPEVSPN